MHTMPEEFPVRFGLPITVLVGYRSPNHLEEPQAVRSRWDFVRRLIATSVDGLGELRANRAALQLPVRINRLRAMRNDSALDVLLRRIRSSDILVFDITRLDHNLLLEVGMALAWKGTSGAVLPLQEVDAAGEAIKGADHPSDLQGYFLTRYRSVAKGRGRTFQLIEPEGFASALRPRLIKAARERGLWTGAHWTVSDETPPARAYRCGSPAMPRADHSRKANKPYN